MKNAIIEEIAGNWEVMAAMEDAAHPARRATFRECADLLRSLAASDKSGEREQQLEELVRSACAIADRRGAETAWDRFTARAKSLGLNGVTARTYRILPSDEPVQEAEQAATAAVTDDLAQAIAACDVNMDETQVEPEDTAAWKIVRAALFSEKRKALELQRVYDERGRQIGRLETAIERAQPAAPAVTDAEQASVLAARAEGLIRELVSLWDSGPMPVDDYNDAMCAVEDRMRSLITPATTKG